METNKAIPRERITALQQVYDTLCFYLGFYDDEKHLVREILDGDFIKPFFEEYRHDHLEVASQVEDIDCDELFRLCRSTNAFALLRYASSAVSNRGGWTALDYALRFVVRVLRFSWENEGEWTHGRFDPDNDQDSESDTEFYQVWAILRYLQAEWEAANVEQWEVRNLCETFTNMLSSRP
ncbi:uncharacterized protein GGS22DRAFT_82393 [Annulohypoxylon maeteangense]|uniref:uncharacterized protein n=1 Tax=Annulohypoxylon maeteangense TaxID=1927788 RepID=UPI002007BDDD|nr:uncharacterized protein GGS22DRAFT_82393 [Annulohypoxylon maeteangense]KAI0880521.1 hypothetical protein GGS22DRAFT_82393 [Annulohypoxylon maeteangense]